MFFTKGSFFVFNSLVIGNLLWPCDEKRKMEHLLILKEKMLDGLSKCLDVEWLLNALQVWRDQDVWKSMIGYVEKQGT